MSEILTISEAARLLHVHPDTLRRQVAEGQWPTLSVRTTAGGHRRFLKTEVEQAASERVHEPGSVQREREAMIAEAAALAAHEHMVNEALGLAEYLLGPEPAPRSRVGKWLDRKTDQIFDVVIGPLVDAVSQGYQESKTTPKPVARPDHLGKSWLALLTGMVATMVIVRIVGQWANGLVGQSHLNKWHETGHFTEPTFMSMAVLIALPVLLTTLCMVGVLTLSTRLRTQERMMQSTTGLVIVLLMGVVGLIAASPEGGVVDRLRAAVDRQETGVIVSRPDERSDWAPDAFDAANRTYDGRIPVCSNFSDLTLCRDKEGILYGAAPINRERVPADEDKADQEMLAILKARAAGQQVPAGLM